MNSDDINLYKSLVYTQDANETRPYQMMIRNLSKISKENVEEKFILYYLATLSTVLRSGRESKKIEKPTSGSSFRKNVRSYIQLINMMQEAFGNEEIIDDVFVTENFSYFSNLKKELGYV